MWAVRFLLLFSATACASGRTGNMGSCFFVSPSGLVLTSLHVVKNARRISVIDSVGHRSRAKILEQDERLDLAMMEARDFDAPAVLPVADNDAVLGDHVVAIRVLLSGPQVTEGSIVEQHALGMEFLLGTSAQVERGSSGGPLVNEHGEVVGVMTKRRDAPSGEAAKLSFAVKSSSARKAFRRLPIERNATPIDRRDAIDRAQRASCMIFAR